MADATLSLLPVQKADEERKAGCEVVRPTVVLLREYGDERAGWSPVDLPKDYASLEAFGYVLFDKQREGWLLHFHFEGYDIDRCDLKAKRDCWDRGTYFIDTLVSMGALRLIAHFVEKRRGLLKRAPQSPISRAQKRRRENEEEAMSDLAMRDIQAVATEEALPVAEIDMPVSQWKPAAPVYPHGYPPLPRDATYVNWLTDFDSWTKNNAAPGDPITDTGFETRISVAYRRALAHARLIKGKYGIVAGKPCIHCAQAGLVCRVYHPGIGLWNMTADPENQFGRRCAYCRPGIHKSNAACLAHWKAEGGDSHFVRRAWSTS
ncbi:hypothetical protein BU26DRAFT_75486 [Trematosphaeria pertusa]|uniref:Uncharacterized protein n=1 Tax=Trematosphaeria pertusa TaxID=390896 RepID=A0A6A6I750_9PLEO|nr:uncharacterized protein BU26DRAFT_75486 [Trematosphaeria pertusa]KAF2245772.1 hypothetical protein BU26DRAFT_75486 [Trematosphaeria pertusa]